MYTEQELVSFGNYLLGAERGKNINSENSPNADQVHHADIENWKDSYPQKGFGLTFGQAIEAVVKGHRICRQGWNGKSLFVFQQVPAEISQEIIPKMQSLPQSVKEEFIKRGTRIKYENQLALVHPDSTINGWSPSVSDALANDWEILPNPF